MGAKVKREYFQFPDFWSIPYKVNCHNSRTSDDIEMKLCPVTKLDKRKKSTSKKFDDEVISKNCDFTVIFPIYGEFEAIWRPHSGRIVCKT